MINISLQRCCRKKSYGESPRIKFKNDCLGRCHLWNKWLDRQFLPTQFSPLLFKTNFFFKKTYSWRPRGLLPQDPGRKARGEGFNHKMYEWISSTISYRSWNTELNGPCIEGQSWWRLGRYNGEKNWVDLLKVLSIFSFLFRKKPTRRKIYTLNVVTAVTVNVGNE